MSDITPITNYVAQAKKRLLAQFKGKPNINALLTILIEQLQSFENVMIEVLRNRWIDTAVGVQLDGLGQNLGVERKGRNDEDYRNALYLQIGINTSNSTALSIIDIVGIITNSSIVELTEYFPACIDIYIDGSNINDDIANMIQRIIAAGVCLRMRVGKNPFGFLGDATAMGFNDVDYDQGGGLVDVLNTATI
jgi:hypothetical protein